jgi:hypothetical protein
LYAHDLGQAVRRIGERAEGTRHVCRRQKKRFIAPKLPKLPSLIEGYNPRRMLSVTQWCALNGFSDDLGRRILSGLTSIAPPKVTQLSDRRIGIRSDHNAEWQDAQVRAEPKMPPPRRRSRKTEAVRAEA